MGAVFKDLIEHIDDKPIINTHSHHLPEENFNNLDLDSILKESYVDWCGVEFGSTNSSKHQYLNKVKFNSYYVWLHKSLQELYDIEAPLSVESWDLFSRRINEAYNKNSDRHLYVLKTNCRYKRIILDAYWDPGSDNGHPELFAPTFRINMFMFGYSAEDTDHNGNNAQNKYNTKINDIDEYVAFMKETIYSKKQQGCVALKSALAYDRGLDFEEVPKEKAQKAFGRTGYVVTKEDIKAFQDYIFYQICKIAAELDMPFQCHTGLGILQRTSAMNMYTAIERNPDTKFVLFHCGYPWMDDVCGLLHYFHNVYPDLCWLPMISTSAAERMLHELIEVGTSEKVCWGCDTWTSEESYGALLAVRHVLAKVLESKIQDGYLSFSDAKVIIDNILYNNAKKLYKL